MANEKELEKVEQLEWLLLGLSWFGLLYSTLKTFSKHDRYVQAKALQDASSKAVMTKTA